MPKFAAYQPKEKSTKSPVDQTKLQPMERTIEPCEVMTIPAGAMPKAISVKLPGIDGATVKAWWSGAPALAAGNFVAVQRRNQGGAQYTITGVSGGTASTPATHTILSATHSDTLADTIVAGDILYGNNTPRLARLPKGTDGEVLTLVSGLPSWEAGGSGWPFGKVLTVSTTNPGADHSTIAAAIAAASDGDTILLDTETFTVTTLTISKAVTIIGLDPINTIITSSTDSTVTVDITAAGVMFRNLTINWTGAGTAGGCIQSNRNNTVLENVNLNKTSGAASLAACYIVYGGTHRLTNCHFSCTAGTNRYGIYSITASTTIIIENGEIGGSTYDLYSNQAGAVLNINNVWLTNSLVSWAGTINDKSLITRLWESDGGAVAAQTDAAGNLTLNGTRDIFPQASVNGLNARFERLFGDDKPANTYQFTRRTFQVNNFANDKAGFEDSQGSPYSFGGSPGGFSLSTPASSYEALSSNQAHWLRLRNWHASSLLYVQWTSSTGKTDIYTVLSITPLTAASDRLVGEIRFWGVQSPGAADKYWAIRWLYEGSTSPQHPLRVGVYYGTGVTFTSTNGTLVGSKQPFSPGVAHEIYNLINSGPSFFGIASLTEGMRSFDTSTTQATWPVSAKTIRWVVAPVNFDIMWIDEIRVT